MRERINIILEKEKGYLIGEKTEKEADFIYNYPAIKKIIKEMSYTGNGRVKDEKVEFMSALPPLAEIFYELVLDKVFPTQDRFISEVFDRHFLVSEDKNVATLKSTGVDYSYEGIEGRVYRMYPSLLRDYLFFILCTISKQFDEVKYSLELDWVYGYDLLITHKGRKFGIALFTSTKRAFEFKGEKGKRRRKTMDGVTEIALTINPFAQDKKVGDYALYNSSDVDNLKSEIEKHLSTIKKAS